MPAHADGRVVVPVPGDHSLKTDVDAVAAAVRAWLPRIVPEAAGIPTHVASDTGGDDSPPAVAVSLEALS